MQTGRLPGNRGGEAVLAMEDQPFKVKLDLQKRTIGQLLAELSHLHSDQRCSCPAQHKQIDLNDPAVQAFVKGPLNGGHKQVDLRMCAFWLAHPSQNGPTPIGNDLSVQEAADYLPKVDEDICIIARAGDILCSQLMCSTGPADDTVCLCLLQRSTVLSAPDLFPLISYVLIAEACTQRGQSTCRARRVIKRTGDGRHLREAHCHRHKNHGRSSHVAYEVRVFSYS